MKALSVKQPWAWLIIYGFKDIENRSWKTNLRGRFAVHASGSVDMNAYYALIRRGVNLPPVKNLQRGGIIGTVELVDCVQAHKSQWAQNEGNWHFVLSNPQPCAFYKMKGQLNFFDVPYLVDVLHFQPKLITIFVLTATKYRFDHFIQEKIQHYRTQNIRWERTSWGLQTDVLRFVECRDERTMRGCIDYEVLELDDAHKLPEYNAMIERHRTVQAYG